MKVPFLPVVVLGLFGVASPVHAETACGSVARGMEIMAETPTFTMIAVQTAMPDIQQRMELTPETVTLFWNSERRVTSERALVAEGMRKEAERIRSMTACVRLGEENLDGRVTLVFAPEGEDRTMRVWLGKNDGRVYKVMDEDMTEIRIAYPPQ